MTGVELDVLCGEWLEKNFPSCRRYYSPYYWLPGGHFPAVFQRVMRRLAIDWRDNIGDATADQVDLGDARRALGLTHTAVPTCFEKSFRADELQV